MAQLIDLIIPLFDEYPKLKDNEQLGKIFKEIAKQERYRCARIAENFSETGRNGYLTAHDIATAIRNLQS